MFIKMEIFYDTDAKMLFINDKNYGQKDYKKAGKIVDEVFISLIAKEIISKQIQEVLTR